jgi:hypothetical protein
MPVRCLSRAEAADLVRHCLSAGRVIPGKHFREELANEGLDILDAHHVLRKGNIFQEPETDIRSGDWKYRKEPILKESLWLLSFASRMKLLGS